MFKLKEVSHLEVKKIIMGMGNNTSSAHDKMNALAIKLGVDILHRPIAHTINLSIKHSVFPPRWKIGKILPLHKGKGLDHRDPASFRPISLLPILGKIAERMIQPQIMNYMNNSGQLN